MNGWVNSVIERGVHVETSAILMCANFSNRLLKNCGACFDRLSMNGFLSKLSTFDPFVLSYVEGLRSFFSNLLHFAAVLCFCGQKRRMSSG